MRIIEEIWLPAPGFNNYVVSSLGRIRELSTSRIRQSRTAEIRLKLGDCWHCVQLARLILTAFCGPPPTLKHVARHLNDDRSNNRLMNLAWGTQKDNTQDAIRNGRMSFEHLNTEEIRNQRRINGLGKKQSEEAKRRIGIATKARAEKARAEGRAQKRPANLTFKGRKHSEQDLQKMSVGRLRYLQTPGALRKHSEAITASWAKRRLNPNLVNGQPKRT